MSVFVFGIAYGLSHYLFDLFLTRAYSEYAAALFGLVVVFPMWYFLRGFVDNLTAYLYVSGGLETTVTFREAQELAGLFKPTTSGKWNPMTEVLKLPVENRKDYLFFRAYPNGRPNDVRFVVDNDGNAKDIRNGK